MNHAMRPSTLETLGLGTVLDMIERGRPPADGADLVDQVFGPEGERGALVISGANGIVGAGKTMQLGSRLVRYGVPVVALDLPGAPDGIGPKVPGLVASFGREAADAIMENVVRMSYDGKRLPGELGAFAPRFVLEAIPEILSLKKAHYEVFRGAYPEIEIRSVTSGFPSKELGVGIAHPAFPHEINKVWEIVEAKPSAITQLFWALGMVPARVSDHWSFVLDVLFCGLTLAALRYHRAANVPFWKIDKLVRRLVGPNPFRAHDAIGAKGADFLTWSCLFHLSKHYGEVFTPTPELDERKETGQDWYPPNHFRPVVDWSLDESALGDLETWVLGPLFQMTSLIVHEERAEPAVMNIIGELCAQFRRGALALVRDYGSDRAQGVVARYHELHPAAAKAGWHPEAFDRMDTPRWQQLYVNAEHNGTFGVITIGREAYNADVDAELDRAITWLRDRSVECVVVTGDFHLATQMVGADTSEFFPALEDEEAGFNISRSWSATARRLHDEFRTSVGLVAGKRCLGGMLELLAHCHYLLAVDDAQLGFPEVTLPVIPGMEGCHWTFRKAARDTWPHLARLLLEGRPVRARDAVGWLVDASGSLEEMLATAGRIVTDGDHGIRRRTVEIGALRDVSLDAGALASEDPGTEAARRAIAETVAAACGATLADAIDVQARHSAAFMTSKACRAGVVGQAASRVMRV